MQVYLTFDIEVWCGGWQHLDERFPGAFSRYVYGRSRHGDYALPATLEMLNRHGLQGVFFVEPLFAARFGAEYLAEIVELIQGAGQDVQLHLHPEWVDEITPPLLPDISRKRQHMRYYTREEQSTLIGYGRRQLEEAGVDTVNAFRAGSFAANLDTFTALADNGIAIDSSLNATMPDSAPELPRGAGELLQPQRINGVYSYPISVFVDGFRRPRHAQVGACSFPEMRAAMLSAERLGHEHFVVVSHNFEMLRPNSTHPDWIVAGRYRRLCQFLGNNKERFPTARFGALREGIEATDSLLASPVASPIATAQRYTEQATRRLLR